MQLAHLLFIMTADPSHLSIFLKGCFECDDLGKFKAHLSTASVVLKRLASRRWDSARCLVSSSPDMEKLVYSQSQYSKNCPDGKERDEQMMLACNCGSAKEMF